MSKAKNEPKAEHDTDKIPVRLTTDITLSSVNFKAGATVAVSEQTASWLIAQNSAKAIKETSSE